MTIEFKDVRKTLKLATTLFIICSLSGCAVRYKNIVYIQDKFENNASDTINTSTNQEIILRTGDNLYINMIGAPLSDLGIYYKSDNGYGQRDIIQLNGYMIDPEGYINFPMIGKQQLAGLTLHEARSLIQNQINEYIANVVVDIRLLNYNITVLGEVARPGTYTFDQREVNLLDAIGRAGDCTQHADRAHVIVLRKEANNTKSEKLNLLSSDFVSNPYYWLKPNDIIYIRPTRSKTISTNTQLLSILLTITTIMLYINNISK